MNSEFIGPTLMIVISVGSSVVYFAKGDLGHGLYWMAGAVLNTAVTFTLPRLPWGH